MSTVLETQRLRLRPFASSDAPVVLELVNDPLWLRFIGDRNVHTAEDARRYLDEKIIASYGRHGFGLYLVERKPDGEPLGMCGLVKRDTLPHADIGFAFLERHRGRGYALEAARATLEFAEALGLDPVLAIATAANERSVRLLERLGFRYERALERDGSESAVNLYSRKSGCVPGFRSS